MRPGCTTTARSRGAIQQRCKQFGVRNVCDCLKTAAHDETALLTLPPQQKIYTREVFLLADNRPVVFAHSVVAPQHLRGAWQALQHLGSRPLGALLFAHPLVQRAPLHYRTLKPHHPLYRRAVSALDTPPQKLWARRSLFHPARRAAAGDGSVPAGNPAAAPPLLYPHPSLPPARGKERVWR